MKSVKYQDFVIKDGEFVGEFEEMYQQVEDPWNQTKKEYVENSITSAWFWTYGAGSINSVAA